jgi:hypothetical protein
LLGSTITRRHPPGYFKDAGELHATRAQVVNVSLGVLEAVFKGALFLGLAPENSRCMKYRAPFMAAV